MNKVNIGKNIKARRNELKLSQKYVAEAAGITQPTLSDLENGISEGSTYLPQIATVLKTTVNKLVGKESGDKKQELLESIDLLDEEDAEAVLTVVRSLTRSRT